MRTNLKVLRVRNKYTQAKMAAEIGFGSQIYAAVENGTRRGSEEFWQCVQTRFNVPDSEMWGLMQDE